ncbi:MAG: 2-amino-4-hydroxy-6-hydroxymethyldihydropteridine diphosphokinase [Chloroflexota bacterium]
METVYLGMGSNLGNREANLARALELLSDKIKLDKTSRIYDTEPVGKVDQPRFLNMVCRMHTLLSPVELLMLVKDIEREMGRIPATERNSPRMIDIDILFFGNRIINTGQLVIPHPALTSRAFVLVPLAEIAPKLVHPVSRKTVSELLKGVHGKDGVILHDSAKAEKHE